MSWEGDINNWGVSVGNNTLPEMKCGSNTEPSPSSNPVELNAWQSNPFYATSINAITEEVEYPIAYNIQSIPSGIENEFEVHVINDDNVVIKTKNEFLDIIPKWSPTAELDKEFVLPDFKKVIPSQSSYTTSKTSIDFSVLITAVFNGECNPDVIQKQFTIRVSRNWTAKMIDYLLHYSNDPILTTYYDPESGEPLLPDEFLNRLCENGTINYPKNFTIS